MYDQLNRYHYEFLAHVVIKTIYLVTLCNFVIVFQKTKSVTKSRLHCNISRYKCGIFKKFLAPLCPSYYVAKQMMQRIGFALRMSRRESRQIGRSPLQQVFERETELMQIPFFYMYESRYRVKGRSLVSTRGIYDIESTLKSWCNPAMNSICLWCRQIIITTQSETLRNRKLKHVYSKRISLILDD